MNSLQPATKSRSDTPKNTTIPSPYQTLANCVWLPRIIAKARLLNAASLPDEYAARFCHPSGVDGHFLDFFGLTIGDILAVCEESDEAVAAWFKSLPTATPDNIAEWNHTAHNLGKPGYPLAERFPIALKTIYAHVAASNPQTVFEALVIDEAGA